jgi:lysophospholipase L1-like esterase
MWVAVLCAAGCDHTPTQPTPVDLKITCPLPVTGQSTNGLTAAVSYPPPAVAGGTAPVSAQCSPASGNFPIGATPVTCTATDARSQSDRCTFTVTVTSPPRIGATRFVAFGDSMTEGKLALFGPSAIGDPGPPVGYVFKLKAMLEARYTAQPLSVTDEGLGGETTAAGLDRLMGVLIRDQPEVLLLLEGVNDLNGGHDAAIPGVVSNLRSMIRLARSRGVVVLIGTLLPERPGGFRALAPASIAPANSQIRPMALAEGAVMVDLFPVFDGHTDTLLGEDGLHPNDAGYTLMADTFFAAVKSRFEAAPTMTSFGSLTNMLRHR